MSMRASLLGSLVRISTCRAATRLVKDHIAPPIWGAPLWGVLGRDGNDAKVREFRSTAIASGQYPDSILMDCNGVLPVCRPRAVRRDNCPLVVQHRGFG